ncbi:MAG TPA: hypothetical protein VHK28_08010 [Candidatus Limnocylindria bacterium]|nr:hypothetical protein [Candidatus Limnocylindria bacterium]
MEQVADDSGVVRTLRVQGAYYLLSGLTPLVAYRAFVWVTGPKRDDWLVKTFGLVVAGFGAALLRRPSPEVASQAATVAAAIGLAEAWYVLRGRIRTVYLADAVMEGILAARLAAFSRSSRRAAGHERPLAPTPPDRRA